MKNVSRQRQQAKKAVGSHKDTPSYLRLQCDVFLLSFCSSETSVCEVTRCV